MTDAQRRVALFQALPAGPGAIFPPSGVIVYSSSVTTPLSFCPAGRKN